MTAAQSLLWLTWISVSLSVPSRAEVPEGHGNITSNTRECDPEGTIQEMSQNGNLGLGSRRLWRGTSRRLHARFTG